MANKDGGTNDKGSKIGQQMLVKDNKQRGIGSMSEWKEARVSKDLFIIC